MLENKGTKTILNSAYAPKINAYLKAGNQSTSYYATGNPSEPNYTALGGADDFGIADDNQWNCNATGANAPTDVSCRSTQRRDSPVLRSCRPRPPRAVPAEPTTTSSAKPNLFNAITDAGMTWRTYNESMNPGQDIRTDSVADPQSSRRTTFITRNHRRQYVCDRQSEFGAAVAGRTVQNQTQSRHGLSERAQRARIHLQQPHDGWRPVD